MKVLFVRHCESEANILRELSNRGLRHPLTLAGREQASILGDKLRDKSITRVYSSPLLRAIETSVIIANLLGSEYEVSEALREYDLGDLEGRADEEAWQQWQRLFDSWSKHQRWEERIKGGESFYEVKNRFVPFINGLVQKYQSTDANLLCVGHFGLYAMMLPLVLNNIDSKFIHEQKGFSFTDTVVSELTPKGLTCTDWNGTKISQ